MRRHREGRRALLAGLLLAGCAHLPDRTDPRDRLPKGPVLADRSPAAAEPRSPEEEADAGAQGLPPNEASSVPDGGASRDLFDRMRSGFGLPSVKHLSVAREVDWYLGHSVFLERTFGRGKRYLHHIVAQLEARNMPRELALLPVVESAFDPFALSRCRASGLWQFLPRTGRRYGLDQDWWTDGRRDVLEATRAALDHLEDLHQEFEGDWLLALAAYNAGAPSVRRAMVHNQRTGRPIDFFALDLPGETRAYVPKLLAISRLVAAPQAFGVELPAIPDAPYFARIDIRDQIDLGRVADRAEIPREELRALNPAFNRWATAPGGPHPLLVPVPAKERFERVLASLTPRDRLRLLHHRVRRGDTLYGIARRHGISLATLRAVNQVRGSRIHPGQNLLVPLPYRTGDPVDGGGAV